MYLFKTKNFNYLFFSISYNLKLFLLSSFLLILMTSFILFKTTNWLVFIFTLEYIFVLLIIIMFTLASLNFSQVYQIYGMLLLLFTTADAVINLSIIIVFFNYSFGLDIKNFTLLHG